MEISTPSSVNLPLMLQSDNYFFLTFALLFALQDFCSYLLLFPVCHGFKPSPFFTSQLHCHLLPLKSFTGPPAVSFSLLFLSLFPSCFSFSLFGSSYCTFSLCTCLSCSNVSFSSWRLVHLTADSPSPMWCHTHSGKKHMSGRNSTREWGGWLGLIPAP